MAMQIRKAQRRKAKLRLGIAGPAGAGKTYSSLLIGYGICADWTKICLIDTENGSGDLYAELGDYNVITLSAPYTPEKYIEAIRACEDGGMDVIIIDSLTHAWAGEGGLLDQQGKMADKSGNSYTAWRSITPKHNMLVEAILSSSCHVICALRAKMDYVQEKDEKGKTIVRKVGMGAIQRDGMEYEFTVFMDIDQNHYITATKDRTRLLDGQIIKPDKKLGQMLKAWLETGTENDPDNCSECGKHIRVADGASVEDIIKYSTEQYGVKLCSECLKKRYESG